jgi:hypothetical protein
MAYGQRVTRGGGGGITDPMAAIRAQAQAATSISTAPRPAQTYTAPRPQPTRSAPQPPPPQQPAYPSFIPSPDVPQMPSMPQMPVAAPQAPAAAQVEPAMAGLQQAMDQEPGVGWGAEGAMGSDPRLGQRSIPVATRILGQLARVY